MQELGYDIAKMVDDTEMNQNSVDVNMLFKQKQIFSVDTSDYFSSKYLLVQSQR